MTPSVAVIVLNYQGLKWLDACLSSLAATDYPKVSQIFVDNASTDGSAEFVSHHFPAVKVIQNRSNLGFSEGNNVGIRAALAEEVDYVVLLNPDTKVRPDWLSKLISVGEKLERAGIIGAVQLEYDSDELNSWTRSAFPRLSAELNKASDMPDHLQTEWVEGACFAIKRPVLEQVGLLDPIYFAFYEEIDFCRRASLHGWETVLATRARIQHFRGGSWQANAVVSRERDYRCDRSQFIYTITEPRRPLFKNIGWYFVTLGTKTKELVRDFSGVRLWDLIRMQFDVMGSSRALFDKWKRERFGREFLGSVAVSPENADQNARRTS